MKKMIAWMVDHPIVVNLLMVSMALAGLVAIETLPKETFPETALDMLVVEVKVPGAGAEEIERGVLLKVEEAISGVSGIAQVRAEAKANVGLLRVELKRGAKSTKVLREVKDKVEQISSFPKDAEKPRVYEVTRRVPVLHLALYGRADRGALQALAQKLKDDLLAHEKITQVAIEGSKAREIAVEVNEAKLRQYGLQIADVSRVLRQANLDLSGGTLRSRSEDLRIRIYSKRYRAQELGQLVVRHVPGGNVIRLAELARVKETFADSPQQYFFNGREALLLSVQSESGGNVLAIAAAAKEKHKELQQTLPAGIKLVMVRDYTLELKSRITLLLKNGLQGLVLVLVMLSFFMNLRLAFWVAVGLLLSLIGSWVMASFGGLSINMISLFGLMLVIGILVDDAIVIGENIYAHLEQGKTPRQAAIDGAREVFPAVLTAVVTTCLAFLPLFFMGGMAGKFIYMIPAMVVAALVVSLIESILILPPHLAHALAHKGSAQFTQNRVRQMIDASMDALRTRWYASALRFAMRHRWPVLAASLGLLLLTAGLFQGGLVKFVFFPKLGSDRVVARFTLKPGTPLHETKRIAQKIETSAESLARSLKKKYGKEVILFHSRWLGRQTAMNPGFSGPSGEEVGEVQLELLAAEQRGLSSQQLLNLWRKRVGAIAGVSQLSFGDLGAPPLGRPLEFQLLSADAGELSRAAGMLKRRLASFGGVYGPEDDLDAGKREVRMQRTSLARSLGIPMQTIANQVRYRIYGQEVMRLQRGQDEVRIVVRTPSYAAGHKGSQAGAQGGLKRLEDLWIQTPQGKRIPLAQLVTWKFARSLKVIRRIDRKRVATVYAQLDESKANREDIIGALKKDFLPSLAARAPQTRLVFAGQGREQAQVFGGMKVAFPLALFAIIAVLLIIFQSYTQVFLVLAMVPFGVAGAVIGHWLMGFPLTILSFFGLIGASGVVINDSILLVDTINRRLKRGESVWEATWMAGQSRLRAILSTTLTTFVGLAPLLLEQSRQAQFLIPMALALASGVLFATIVTLFLIPCYFLVINDVKRIVMWMRDGRWRAPEEVEAAAITELPTPAPTGSGAVSAPAVVHAATEPI